MKYLRPTRLSCFSPPVMLATFAIEVSLAAYTLMRYKMSIVTKLATAVLLSLAAFQVAEYNVCEGSWGLSGLTWARLGYVAITLLPPLGLHMATKIAGEQCRALVAGSYALAAGFAGLFLFATNGVAAEACLGNYVIFQQAPGSGLLYGAYYYGLLMVAVGYAWSRARVLKDSNHANALRSLAFGYLAFMVPTTMVNIVDPSTIQGIPSIMCGFAVLLAVILAARVLPAYYKVNDSLLGRLKARFLPEN